MKLQIGAIKIATVNGPIVIAGWHDRTFGVDWRSCFHDLGGSPGAYVVSHLASGHAILAIVANIEDVEGFLERLHTVGAWNFSTVEQANAMILAHKNELQALFDTVYHHDPKCFAMAPGDHGIGSFGNA